MKDAGVAEKSEILFCYLFDCFLGFTDLFTNCLVTVLYRQQA